MKKKKKIELIKEMKRYLPIPVYPSKEVLIASLTHLRINPAHPLSEKQDETFDAVVAVSEKIDRSKEEIVTEISSLRDDLRSYMEEKITRIKNVVEAIKVKIGRV